MNPRKVLLLTASPDPEGNTAVMAKEFAEAASARGAVVTRYDMATVSGEGCRACMACRTVSDHCVVEDGVGEVLRAFIDTDVLVMAAPVWFLEFPCSIRRFVERWHALLTAAFESRLPCGKKAVLLISQGGAEGEFKELPARYVEMLGWLGVADIQIVRHCNAEECPVHERGEILDDVRDAAVHALG